MSLQGGFWFSPICDLPNIQKAEHQSSSAPTRRSKWLLGMLRSCKDVHKRAAPSILEALDKLIRQVETEKIAIADSKDQAVFYGKRYILSSIAELFDPLLDDLIPPGSDAHNIASAFDCLLPLSSSLSERENCKHVASNLDDLSKQIKKLSEYEPDQANALRENIHCIRVMLDAVCNVLPVETLDWCEYCFRRAAINSKYCDLHRSSDDTSYRTGKRIYDSLPSEMLEYRTRYRTTRRALGESFNLVSRVDDITPAISKGPCITVPNQVAQLVEQTLSDWRSARVTWTHIIEDECRSLSKIISADMPCAHSSWESWITAIRVACQDELEYTTHPYWILNIVGCAEDWFGAQSIAKDQRKTDTEEKIKALWEADITNSTNIARQLNMTRQNVSRVVKRLGLRK